MSNIENSQKSFIDKIGYFIIYLMVGFIPHIYKYAEYRLKDNESIYFNKAVFVDLYVLVKSRVFLLLTCLLLSVFLYQILKRHIGFIKDKITIGTGIFAVIVILSSVISEYQDIVYFGGKDRFEGMWVWLAYLVVFTVTRHYSSNRLFADRLLKVFVFSASVMAIFGLMQVKGYDIYTEGFLRWVCFPKEAALNMDAYILSNTTETLAVGALYNGNYFGVYCALSALGSMILLLKGNAKSKVVFGLTALLSYGGMIASRSEASLLGFAVALLALILLSGEECWKNKLQIVLLTLGLFLVDRKVVDILSGNQSGTARYIYYVMAAMIVLGVILRVLLTKFVGVTAMVKKYSLVLAVFTVLFSIIGFNVMYKYLPSAVNKPIIDELKMTDNYLTVRMTGDESLKVEFLPTGINAYGEDGRAIIAETVTENEVLLKTNEQSYQVRFKMYSNGYLATVNRPIELNVFYDGKSIQYVDKITGVGEIQYPDRFKYYYNKGNMFSKRGYIWGVYLPLVKNNLLLGSGLDTYINVFPQSDFIGKNNNFVRAYSDIVIDKPHSMYLMTGVALGVFGLTMLLLMIIAALNSYFSGIGSPKDGISFFVLLTAIFIAGIFNDSTIPITILMSCFGGGILSPMVEEGKI